MPGKVAMTARTLGTTTRYADMVSSRCVAVARPGHTPVFACGQRSGNRRGPVGDQKRGFVPLIASCGCYRIATPPWRSYRNKNTPHVNSGTALVLREEVLSGLCSGKVRRFRATTSLRAGVILHSSTERSLRLSAPSRSRQIAAATTAAVSVRRIRGPMLTNITLASRADASSARSNPLSGPMNRAS